MSARGASAPDGDLFEQYLDDLYARLRCAPRDARRILAEAEDHLREAVSDGLAAGLTQAEAEEQAISSFGSARAVVRAHDREAWRFPGRAVLFDLTLAGLKLGGIGTVAVAASGLVALAMNLLFGPAFVGGSRRGIAYPEASCRWWLADNPGAHTCAQAAVLEGSVDAVTFRLAVGILGLILLLAYSLAPRGRSRHVLPDGFVPTIAVSLFGAAGLGLAVLATAGGQRVRVVGPGWYLSGALVALIMAAAYALQLNRTLLRRARG
jgi:hypothetical protein